MSWVPATLEGERAGKSRPIPLHTLHRHVKRHEGIRPFVARQKHPASQCRPLSIGLCGPESDTLRHVEPLQLPKPRLCLQKEEPAVALN